MDCYLELQFSFMSRFQMAFQQINRGPPYTKSSPSTPKSGFDNSEAAGDRFDR